MRQLAHLLQKLVDTFYKKEKTSQQPLMGVLRGACSQFLQEESVELQEHNRAQVCLWICIILSWSCKEIKGKVLG